MLFNIKPSIKDYCWHLLHFEGWRFHSARGGSCLFLEGLFID